MTSAFRRTISVSAVLDRGKSKDGLRKRLGAKDMIGFGVGIIIGTGIFTLAGVEAKQHAGPAVTLSFVIGAVVAALAAICYAEMASSVPTAGSAYTYAFATLGEGFAWIIGWDLLLEFSLGAAVVSRGWSGYLADLFGLPPELFGEEAVVNVGAVLILAILTVVAVVGIKMSALFTNALVVVKLIVCVLVIGIGAFFVTAANWRPFVPESRQAEAPDVLKQPIIEAGLGIEPTMYGTIGLLTAAAVVFFAYTGFEALANLGEEVRRPQRDLTIGLLGALSICAVLYVGVSLVLTGMVPYAEIDSGAPLAKAFDAVGLSWVGGIISLGAVTGLTSVILVQLVTIGRIGFSMGRDGLLPRQLGTVHPRWGTPHRMTVGAAVLVGVLAALVPIDELADMVSIGALSAMIIVAVAVPVLRKQRPDLRRPFRVPFSPVVPALTAAACFYLMLNLDVITWLRFAVWLGLGMVIYFAYGRKHSHLAQGNGDQTDKDDIPVS